MLARERCDDLIRAFYEAVGEERLWPDVLVRLRDAFRAGAAALVGHDFSTGRGAHLYTSGLDPDYSDLYARRFAAENPWLGRSIVYEAGRVHGGHEIVPNWELVQTDFYRQYLKPQGCYHRLCGVVARQGSRVSFLSLYRGVAEPGFGAGERRRLGPLLPHLRQALRLHGGAARCRAERDALLGVLNGLPLAALLVDRELRPVLVNGAARTLLKEEDGVGLVNGRLVAAGRAELIELRHRVAEAAAVPPCEGAAARRPAIGHVVVSRPSGRHPLLLAVSPVARPLPGGNGQAEAVAAIVIRSPEAGKGRGTGTELAALYHLTPAEVRLVTLLVGGCGLFDAAAQIGISRNTARSHMKRIYAKTGTHRQAELVGLLARSCPDSP